MNNSIIVGAASAVMAVLGLSAGVGSVDMVQSLTGPPKPFSMDLERLNFEDGKFVQAFRITGGRSETLANWTAEIKRGEEQLCSAGGTAPYSDSKNGVSRFSPKQWAGKDCPDELQAGDIGHAIWEYRNLNGFVVSISGSVTIQ